MSHITLVHIWSNENRKMLFSVLPSRNIHFTLLFLTLYENVFNFASLSISCIYICIIQFLVSYPPIHIKLSSFFCLKDFFFFSNQGMHLLLELVVVVVMVMHGHKIGLKIESSKINAKLTSSFWNIKIWFLMLENSLEPQIILSRYKALLFFLIHTEHVMVQPGLITVWIFLKNTEDDAYVYL